MTVSEHAARSREIASWLACFVEGPQLAELRALRLAGGRKCVSDYFTGDQLDRAADRALQLEGEGAKGVYFVPNPLRHDLAGSRSSARDDDVLTRRWLLVDVDPVRPADVASTGDERQAAWAVADLVRRSLVAEGLPEPLVADSCNGWHLQLPVEMPNDEPSKLLCKAFLHQLAGRFGNDSAKIDTSVYNAARICRLYGTVSRKGEATTPERPWRRSRLFGRMTPSGAWDLSPAREAADAAAIAAVLDRWARADRMRQGRPEGDRAAYGRKALEEECARVSQAQAGSRNNTLNRAAFSLSQLVAGGVLDRPTVEHRLAEAARAAGLGDAEIATTLRSGFGAGERQPRGPSANGNGHHANGTNGTATTAHAAQAEPEEQPWEGPPIPLSEVPDPAPFPLDVFPPALRRYVEEQAWALSCPPDFVAVPMLGTAGGCIGNSRRLSVTRTHLQSACLFVVVVGSPGSAKSPALDAVAAPLEKAEKRYLQEWKAEVKRWRDRMGDAGPEEPEPVLRRCLVDDATSEALVQVLSANPRGLCMVRDELSALVTGMNQYKAGGKGSDRQVYLKLWAHSSIRIDRKNNPDGLPIQVRRPFVAVVGGIQPGVVDQLRGEALDGRLPPDDGFLDRFLFSYPASLPAVEENWREVSREAAEAWELAVERLLALRGALHEDGGEWPTLLHLDDGAKLAWVRFTREHAAEVNGEDFPPHLLGPWAKLRGYGARLTLVVHSLREVWEGESGRIDGESVERAAKVVAYFKDHARRVCSMIDADPRIAEARHILRWLASRRDREFISKRDLHQGLRNHHRFQEPENLDPPLRLLVQRGYLRPVKNSRKGPGRPSEKFTINPQWHPRNTPYPQNSASEVNSEDKEYFEDLPGESEGVDEEQF